jgi:hypothetical protein
MRILFLLLAIVVFLAACGGSEVSDLPLEQRLIGKWSGAQVNREGNPIPATWEFLEGGTMVVTITGLGQSFGAEWSAEGNRINFTTELDPDEPNYRDVEFVSDDVIKLTKEGIEETFTRVDN